MEAQNQINGEDEGEADVEKGPEVLAVDLPAMLEDGRELVEDPPRGVDVEDELQAGVACGEAALALA